jgi:hypothetical protein
MATARPLRDVFADVTGDEAVHASDPAELLRASGHADLPDTLVAEAVTSFADTAPLEVAEHLSPYVMANSAVPGAGEEVDPSSWLEALSSAPDVLETTVDPAAVGLDEAPDGEPALEAGQAAFGAAAGDDLGTDDDSDFDDGDGFDLDFGFGKAIDTIVDRAVDLFGAAPTPGAGDESFGASAPTTGDESFGSVAAGVGDESFGAATTGLPADEPEDEDSEDDEPVEDA